MEEEGIGGIIGEEDNKRKREEEESYGEEENLGCEERGDSPIILVLYVDDMLLVGKRKTSLDALKDQLKSF